MKQVVKVPKIKDCAICGAKALPIDWDYRDRWQVVCDNNHTSTKECNTVNRAVHRWNAAQERIQSK